MDDRRDQHACFGINDLFIARNCNENRKSYSYPVSYDIKDGTDLVGVDSQPIKSTL